MPRLKFNYSYVLLGLFIVVFGLRMVLSLQTASFSDSESYYTLRQAQAIHEAGLPLYKDPLSYGGRFLPSLFLFYYIVALFSFFLEPVIAGKIVMNLIASLIIFFVFLIANKITQNRKVALFTAAISGFVPIYFSLTINSLTKTTVLVTFSFLFIYLFVTVKEKSHLYLLIILYLLMLLTTPAVVVILFGLFLYIILLKIEQVKVEGEEIEVTLFLAFITFWVLFLFYKEVLLFHGISFIWKNIPAMLVNTLFKSLNIPELVVRIGVLPFICGLYIIYEYVFRKKDKTMYLLISFCITISMLVWLELFEFSKGVIFISIFLTIFFGKAFDTSLQYLEKTKFAEYAAYGIILLVIVFVVSSVVPSFVFAREEIAKSYAKEEIAAYQWLKENTPTSAVVIGATEDGHLITYYGNRKNVLDTNFVMVPDINERYEDLSRVYTTISLTEAINLINKFHGSYVMVTPRAKKEFGDDLVKYGDDPCFKVVYNESTLIYRSLCEIK